MAGELSRVTVVGKKKRVDVAVPSSTPIGEYSARLARLCGQERDPMLPPAWSLAAAGQEPLPLEASLAELRVSDGQVLYLRDLNREPISAPMVDDVEELVANETLGIRKTMVWRGPATATFGLMWMVGTAVWLDLHPTAGSGGAIGLTILALALVGLAWTLGQRGMSMGRPLRLAIALTSVPCLAVAGDIVAEGLGGSGAKWTGIISGATLAALISLAAIADPVLAVVSVQLTAAAGVFAILLAVGADELSAAAFTVLVGMGMLGLVRRTASSMAAFAARAMRRRSTAAGATSGMVQRRAGCSPCCCSSRHWP